MNEKWFTRSVGEIEKKLKTNAASGLSLKAARSRVNRGGGSLFYLPRRPALRLLGDLLADFSLILLLLIACISLFFEDFHNGITVLVLLVANLAIFWLIHVRAQRTAENLEACFAPMMRVVRGGRLFWVDYRSLVPGDVVLLEAGDVVCCDARLITSDGLTVQMRLNKEESVFLEKFAEGHVRPNENQAEHMTNMVHAGSVIKSGCARAIVTAVGRYTYLGAMTGGIPLPLSNKKPEGIERLKKHCFRINLLLLLAVLPFSLIGLFLSFLNGGTVLLSTAFLTALSIVITTMSQLICVMTRLFYIHPMRRLAFGKQPALIRSVDGADQLANTDYLFILDGSAVTDGVMHFQEAIFADGNLRIGGTMSDTAKRFSEMVALYYMGATRTLTTGTGDAGRYFDGIREFLSYSKVDEGALRLRCTVLSYSAGNMLDGYEQVYFRDGAYRYCVTVSENDQLLSSCQSACVGGREQPLNDATKGALSDALQKQRELHRKPLIFTVSNGMDDASCLLGILLMEEGIDRALGEQIKRLCQMGTKPIFFANTWSGGPTIPTELLQTGSVSKREFERHRVPLTHQFGKIRTYLDLEEKDVVYLIRYVHHLKKKVFVVGFSDAVQAVAEEADGWISCAPIYAQQLNRMSEEGNTVEIPGQQNRVSCTQLVKQHADCLISRPDGETGGFRALVDLFGAVKRIAGNYSDLIRYMVATQVMRVLIVALPMLFGHPILDARHVIFCGCVLDVLAWWIFVKSDGRRFRIPQKDYGACKTIGDYLRGDRPVFLAGIGAAAVALLLPMLLGWTGIFGMYHDRIEVQFVSLIALHLVSLICIRYGESGMEFKRLYRNPWLVTEFVGVTLFLLLCFFWEGFGGLFGIETLLTVPFLIVSIIPAIVYAVIFFCLNRKKYQSKTIE